MIIPRHDILYKLSIFQGLKEYKDDRFPDSIYYHKNGVIYFELEKDRLWCNYYLVWYVFSEQNKLDYDETQRVIKDVTEKYTNWGSVTPIFRIYSFTILTEKYTNWGSVTPDVQSIESVFRWKNIPIGGR